MHEPETAEDALCDALLMEFGVGYAWQGTIPEARDLIRTQARLVIDSLRADGYTIQEVPQ